MKIEVFMIIIIGCLSHQTLAKCPSAEVILPCICISNAYIYCGGNSYYDLRNIFVSLSRSALTEEDKHFKQFEFYNTAIDELVSDVFYDITFESIEIGSAYNLTKINAHAFVSTNCRVTQFEISNTPYGDLSTDNNSIFDLINSMTNIEGIEIYNTSLTAIPSNAFIALNKLILIDITDNRKLTSLGSYAFYDLSNLTQLVLVGNPIQTFLVNAFSFRNNNTETLQINLISMPHINSNSFSVGMFATINRPFRLLLANEPQLKYLPENVFNAVLSGGNQIYLYGTRLECDCKMFWLYSNRAIYQSLVDLAMCTDGQSVFTERETFADCKV